MNELIDYLQQRARTPFTVRREAIAAVEEDPTEDQALKVLSGLGGFLASLLFLLFLWLADLLTRPVWATTLGTILIVVTLLLGRTRRQAFLATTTVCGYLVGVGLIMVGLPPSIPTAYLVLPVILIAACTLLFTRNYYLVLLATASLPACLVFLHIVQRSAGWTWFALAFCTAGLALVNLWEYRLLHDARLAPVRTGLAVGLLATLVWFRWAEDLYPTVHGTRTVIPLFGGCLYLLLISFRNQYFFGIGLGIAGLFYFTVQYYYDLRWTLLNKSLSLMVAGGLLLLAYYLLHYRKWRTP